MNSQSFFIPKEKTLKATGNSFIWNLGTGPVSAESTLFYLHIYPPTGEKSWSLSGSTGSGPEENFFLFGFAIPYVSDEIMDASYTMEGGLTFHHIHSIPAPPGFYGFQTVSADKAELTIRLDPIKGTAKGDFSALFKTDGYRLNPTGTFDLILGE
ncbi:hypothetical protein [Pseudomonas brassicacearum]|uniref:Uncharacterized protein n=1 Tax=Pseudomonas brassicacearum TaxID=930166 RepID=A0AAJ3FSP2_9PSED|nr:hypothetical protein [Pseudomonas brassicacearum]NUT79630.1 hypothetical protein [Pseudomonas brassicacearum]QGA49278.1 hypothetical protein GFU70_09100 [Pseudomonas brassicacearum]